MIARLHGRVLTIEEDAIVLDVGGVCYRIYVPSPVLADIRPGDANVTIHTHLHVRENELALFGAADEASLALFRLLLGVSGIGPRLALAILSAFDAVTVQQAIVLEDIALLTQVPGVGRKTAQRMVLDLKGRLEALGVAAGLPPGVVPASEEADAVAALTALGYSVGEARRALAQAGVGPDADLEERILAALRALART